MTGPGRSGRARYQHHSLGRLRWGTGRAEVGKAFAAHQVPRSPTKLESIVQPHYSFLLRCVRWQHCSHEAKTTLPPSLTKHTLPGTVQPRAKFTALPSMRKRHRQLSPHMCYSTWEFPRISRRRPHLSLASTTTKHPNFPYLHRSPVQGSIPFTSATHHQRTVHTSPIPKRMDPASPKLQT